MVGLHCHSHYSNIRLLDSTNKVDELIKTAAELNYNGIAITDHELLSAHVEAIQTVEKFKKEGKIHKDFKLILGNEIYLVDSVEKVRDEYVGGVTKFPHFLLLAKNAKGHHQLRVLSSKAWSDNYFRTGIMERVPTEKSFLEEIVKKDQGNIIASSACLGSELNIYLLELKEAEETNQLDAIKGIKIKIDEFIKWCIDVFGQDNFYIELQPAYSEEQIYCNNKLVPIAKHYGLKWIITTDAHYLRPEDREVHKAYLNAKEGEREVDDFYEACFLQSLEEIKERLNYFDDEIIAEGLKNTLLIGDMVEDYDIRNETIIPKIDLPEFELKHIFKPVYDKYTYINDIAHSDSDQDRYLLYLIEEGFNKYLRDDSLTKEKFHIILSRINDELGELWEISKKLGQSMPSYYVTVKEIIDVIWDDCKGNSLVGSGRGSSSGFIICFLLGITQINPLDYEVEIPHWRHLSKERPDFPDIDIDFEGAKRPQITQALKDHFGHNKVLNVCTFGTEGSKSALQTSCRGLGIDSDTALYLSGMIPFERGANWSLSDCFYGNDEKDRKPVKELIREIEKYPKLKETALKVENLINKRSIHAGGIIVYNSDFTDTSAMMRAPNGNPTTQFNLSQEESLGSIKYDLLTVEAEDKIREALNMLLEYGEIEWQGSLRETFIKYLHPKNIEYNDPKIWKMLGEGNVPDLFQFSTEIGIQSVTKVKPSNLTEMAATNSLMRLMPDDGEQPVDTFVKYKGDIELWYQEMDRYGLTAEEQEIMKEHLLKLNGVADSQESVMVLTMDERIANFGVLESNELRKIIAKKKESEIKRMRNTFFEKGLKNGASENLLTYIWDVQIKRQLGYSFSNNHVIPYSIIALQELNLNYHFNPIYWNTACLTVNSGGLDKGDEDEKNANRTTEYGKIAAAIGNMRQNGVKVALPDVNRAKFGFSPDLDTDEIIFGLKGINGIGDEAVHTILEHRPFQSFNHFLEKLFHSGLIKKGHVIQLIKGGAFDKFGQREEIMIQFIELVSETKQKLTAANLPMIIGHDLLPEKFNLHKRFFRFRKHVLKSVYKTISKPKDKLLILGESETEFFNEHFSDDSIVDMVDNKIVISDVRFKKEYDKKMEAVKEWLQDEQVLANLNKAIINEEFTKYASGTLSKWEMDSISFYYHEHELAHVNEVKYGISNYFKMNEDPTVVRMKKRGDREFPEFDIHRIIGTVLDKDKNKNSITLLTPYGVVSVKFYAGAFGHYNKQISRSNGDGTKTVLEKPWFTRGNKLLISGYRRGNKFVPRTYKDSIYQHTVCLIEDIDSKGNLTLKTEREHV
ncbi:DNA polymerase III subunit alpha [Alkalihalophilus pseudofirmus]|uniref:DNA polymerase III subunit alpha n=1 Tax=Alkalihalophilus pseudofirmus TaxID=79885 RepID=UPI00259B4959|nr:DNA polymerase III subunit alpha [Alkalihalophilus pseudofirmus]WEG19060.1 DNA polymerase III subunit alpha [Alkalihalophilus pseudofirmus]